MSSDIAYNIRVVSRDWRLWNSRALQVPYVPRAERGFFFEGRAGPDTPLFRIVRAHMGCVFGVGGTPHVVLTDISLGALAGFGFPLELQGCGDVKSHRTIPKYHSASPGVLALVTVDMQGDRAPRPVERGTCCLFGGIMTGRVVHACLFSSRTLAESLVLVLRNGRCGGRELASWVSSFYDADAQQFFSGDTPSSEYLGVRALLGCRGPPVLTPTEDLVPMRTVGPAETACRGWNPAGECIICAAEEAPAVALAPCGHVFCCVCAARTTHCFVCLAPHENLVVIPRESPPSLPDEIPVGRDEVGGADRVQLRDGPLDPYRPECALFERSTGLLFSSRDPGENVRAALRLFGAGDDLLVDRWRPPRPLRPLPALRPAACPGGRVTYFAGAAALCEACARRVPGASRLFI